MSSSPGESSTTARVCAHKLEASYLRYQTLRLQHIHCLTSVIRSRRLTCPHVSCVPRVSRLTRACSNHIALQAITPSAPNPKPSLLYSRLIKCPALCVQTLIRHLLRHFHFDRERPPLSQTCEGTAVGMKGHAKPVLDRTGVRNMAQPPELGLLSLMEPVRPSPESQRHAGLLLSRPTL